MHEPLKQTTKKGKTKWYRIGYFIDNDVNTEKHTISLFDFKMLYGKTEKAPGPTLAYNNNVFQWMFNGPNYRVMDNEVGEQYYFDGIGVSLDEKFQAMKGKWVNVLINAKWAEDGFLHLWIDGKLRSSYFGDVLGGASRVRFKFGPYRNYMTDATDAGLIIKDAIIRYSNVGKADTCDDLWSGCDQIIGQLTNESQVNGILGASLCRPAGTDKEGTCKDLGYPKNQRPLSNINFN